MRFGCIWFPKLCFWYLQRFWRRSRWHYRQLLILTAAIGARALAKRNVLPTRLSAVDEAASIDVLCTDKTGTLTRNELNVTTVTPMAGYDAAHVRGLAALASSERGGKTQWMAPFGRRR
jgi:hypothetical protein